MVKYKIGDEVVVKTPKSRLERWSMVSRQRKKAGKVGVITKKGKVFLRHDVGLYGTDYTVKFRDGTKVKFTEDMLRRK